MTTNTPKFPEDLSEWTPAMMAADEQAVSILNSSYDYATCERMIAFAILDAEARGERRGLETALKTVQRWRHEWYATAERIRELIEDPK